MKSKDENKIIRSYAEALYEAAAAQNAADEVFAQVRSLFFDTLIEDKIITALANPLWSNNAKKQALQETAALQNLSPVLSGLFETLAENGRASLLFKVMREFEAIYYKRCGITPVKAVTVIEFSAEQKDRFEKVMQDYVGGKVTINYEICPEILGGLSVEVGGKLIDDTIKGKLKRLELLMKGTK